MNWTHEFRLSSPLEITAAAAKPLPDYAEKAGNAARIRAASQFNGWTTYAQAVALAENGWPDAPRLDILAEQIAPSETRTAHEMQHAVTGAFVDVSRFIEGHPEDMLEFGEEPAPRALSIAVSISQHSGVTARSMELAGAVALAVMDTLAAAGIAADLIGCEGTRGNDGVTVLTSFPLKRAHEAADPNQIAFWLCHPAALRLLVFGFNDTWPADLYEATEQSTTRGFCATPTAENLAVNYVLSTSPPNEQEAAAEYRRIIAEITATL